MNNQLPRPFQDSPQVSPAASGFSDPGVSGFTFLSQPQYNNRGSGTKYHNSQVSSSNIGLFDILELEMFNIF